MPTSLDPQPADNEVECARCGALVYYELTRCPNCGVNLYEPDEDNGNQPASQAAPSVHPSGSLLTRAAFFFRQLFGLPLPVDELFGASLNQAVLFNDLLLKVGGDHAAAKRLVELEKRKLPHGTREAWLRNAIRSWERDNQH